MVGFRGTYHAIIGRPGYAKFMAIPNYTYLKLKMPGPKGVITVSSSFEHAEPSRATKYTSFFMVYGSEAVLPTDLEYGSPRLKAYNEQSNKETQENAVDQLEEARDMALLNSARYQQKLRRYHDKHVRKRDLNVGDLVLRRRQSNQGRHKLTPPWEGPYVVAEVLKPGTYKLADEKGAVFTNAWNIEQLRRFYP